MPIQKFKYGQEITSAKLNEIVSFVNDLEAFSNNAQYWNENIDSKVAGFQTQLNNIVNQIKNLLDTAENFDALLAAFVDLKTKYENLVEENILTLLEQVLSPENFFINQDGFVVINGTVTNFQLEGIPGPQGATGAQGLAGLNGSNGKTIITNTGVPNNNTGTNGDVYFDVNNFDFYLKANDVWGLIGNTKGPQGSVGPQGASARILFRYQTEAGLAYLTEPPASALVKFMEFKVINSNETNQQIELKPWVRLQVRNDRFFPVLVQSAPGQVVLNWSPTEGEWPTNGINIKGEAGTNGINGTNGTNGTSVNIKGSFNSHLDLPSSNAVLGDGYLINGDLWVYTGGVTSGTPPAIGSVTNGFLNAGTIQGPTGPAPVVQAEVVANLSPNESASVSVVNPSEGTYKLNFSIPRGQTGNRGSLIFNVNAVNDLPTSVSWEGNTLQVNDLFIVNTTGGIYRITQTLPWVAPALIYSAAASDHTHGNISNAGVVSTNTAAASGQHLVVTSSADLIQQSAITLGSSTTTFLNNAGSWATPYSHPIQSAIAVNATDDGINVIDSVTVNTLGHVTAVGTRNLSAATASVPGHMTAAYASKLDGIASGAQVNVATNLTYTDSTRVIGSSTGTGATLPVVVAGGNSGLMTGDDKTKLDGIASSANNYTHPSDGTNTTINNTNGLVLSSIAVNTLGHVTAVGSKTLAAADLPSHTHGNITNAGAIGTTATLPIITTTNGVLTTGSFGTTAGTFTQGNDARLSDARTPTSHSHGNISNIGSFNSSPRSIANGNGFVIVQDSLIHQSSLLFGTSTTSFLANNGTWVTPIPTPTTFETTSNDLLLAISFQTIFESPTLPIGKYLVNFNGSFRKTTALNASTFIFSVRFTQSNIARINGIGTYSLSGDNSSNFRNFVINTISDTDGGTTSGFTTDSFNTVREHVPFQFSAFLNITFATKLVLSAKAGTYDANFRFTNGLINIKKVD
jgi:hypothetical protein